MIELRALRKVFGGTVALEEIDLSVPAGEIHGIVGRSGAGKSTLIRCLTGLESPTSGTVSIDGVDLTNQSGAGLREARRSIGMVFQHVNLLDSSTALKNVAHPLKIAEVPKAERLAKAVNSSISSASATASTTTLLSFQADRNSASASPGRWPQSEGAAVR